MLEVSGDTLEKHPKSSSEDVQPSHPLIGQSEEQGRDLLDKIYLDP